MKTLSMICSSCCVSFFSAWAFVWFRPMRANSSGVMSPSPFKSVNWNSFFPVSMRPCSSTFTSYFASLRTSEQSQKEMFPISADNGGIYKRTVRCKPNLQGIKNIQRVCWSRDVTSFLEIYWTTLIWASMCRIQSWSPVPKQIMEGAHNGASNQTLRYSQVGVCPQNSSLPVQTHQPSFGELGESDPELGCGVHVETHLAGSKAKLGDEVV